MKYVYEVRYDAVEGGDIVQDTAHIVTETAHGASKSVGNVAIARKQRNPSVISITRLGIAHNE